MGTNKNKYSIYTWYFGKYKKTIANSENCLPQLELQYGFSRFAGFCKRVVSILRDSTFTFSLAYIRIREEPITGKTKYFTPEVEDEVIREAV